MKLKHVKANKQANTGKESNERTTPKWFFDKLDKIFHFECDVAANEFNTLCDKFYSLENSGLTHHWFKSNWCNPPYGRGEILPFVTKAYQERLIAYNSSILLIPGDMSTGWFKEAHDTCTAMYGLNFRMKFNGINNSAKFASVLAIYGYYGLYQKIVYEFEGMWLKQTAKVERMEI